MDEDRQVESIMLTFSVPEDEARFILALFDGELTGDLEFVGEAAIQAVVEARESDEDAADGTGESDVAQLTTAARNALTAALHVRRGVRDV